MRPPDYCLLGRKKSGVVTDGLIFWMDGQDGLFFEDGSTVPEGIVCTSADNVYVKNRATDELLQVVLSTNGMIKSYENNLIFYKTGTGSETAMIELGSTYTVISTEICGGSLVDGYFFTEIGNLVYHAGVKMIHVGNPVSTEKWAAWERYFHCPGNQYAEIDYEVGTINQLFSNSPNDGVGELFLNGRRLRSYNLSGDFGTEFEPIVGLYKYAYYANEKSATVLPSVRMYNRPLSESEILQNYNYEKSLGRVD